MPTFQGELYPHQAQGLAFLQTQPRAILADEVGLGKTVQLAALIGWLADTGDLRQPAPDPMTLRPGESHLPPLPVLWITAAGLVAQTEAELRRFLPGLAVVTSESGTVGTKADRERMAALLAAHPNGPDIVVTNNDLASRRAEHLSSLRPSMVVVDEASALKGAGSRHEALKSLCDAARRAVAVTATPYENDPMELWAVLSLAGIPGLPDAEAFGQTHVSWIEYPDGRKPQGWVSPAHAAQVMEWLGPRFLRRTAASVGLPLPVRSDDSGHVVVPLNPAQTAEYNRASYIPRRLLRHQRMAKAARRAADGSSSLVDAATAAVVENARGGLKVVIFAEHLDILADLEGRLTDAAIGHVALRGESTKDERSDAVDVFRTDPGTPVLLGTKVLEHGLNLQFAQVLISVGQTYNPARERQREGRLCRIGSPNATYRHSVFLPDTEQTRKQLATLSRKAREASPVLDSAVSGGHV